MYIGKYVFTKVFSNKVLMKDYKCHLINHSINWFIMCLFIYLYSWQFLYHYYYYYWKYWTHFTWKHIISLFNQGGGEDVVEEAVTVGMVYIVPKAPEPTQDSTKDFTPRVETATVREKAFDSTPKKTFKAEVRTAKHCTPIASFCTWIFK